MFEREKLRNELKMNEIEFFSSATEMVQFVFSQRINAKIGDHVWNLPKGTPVSPIVVSRTDIDIDPTNPQSMYYAEFMEEQNAQEDFLCKGANIYTAHYDLFSGLRDYRGRFPATSSKPVLVKLDSFLKTRTPRNDEKSIAIGFMTSFSWLEKTDKVWMPLKPKSDGDSAK
jgi:hypothetical protein